MATETADTEKQSRWQGVSPAAGAVCALVLALGLFVWEGRQAHSRPAASPASARIQSGVGGKADNRPDVDNPADGPWAAARPVPVSRVAPNATVYLVDSPEQAVTLQQALDWQDSIRAALEPVPADVHVVALGSATDGDRLLYLLGAVDAVSAAMGLPAVHVVDLRAP